MITEMWREMGLQDEEKWLDIINLYQGNPLWLKLFAQTIQDLFNHSVAEFTELETKFLPTELQAILQQHWRRLSDIELKIMEILTEHPDGLNLKQISQKIKLDSTISAQISNKVINAVQSLNQRGLLEKKEQNKVKIFRLLPILEAIVSPY